MRKLFTQTPASSNCAYQTGDMRIKEIRAPGSCTHIHKRNQVQGHPTFNLKVGVAAARSTGSVSYYRCGQEEHGEYWATLAALSTRLQTRESSASCCSFRGRGRRLPGMTQSKKTTAARVLSFGTTALAPIYQ